MAAFLRVEILEWRVPDYDGCFADAMFEPVCGKHAPFRQRPTIRIGHVSEGEGETGDFQGKGVNFHTV